MVIFHGKMLIYQRVSINGPYQFYENIDGGTPRPWASAFPYNIGISDPQWLGREPGASGASGASGARSPKMISCGSYATWDIGDYELHELSLFVGKLV